MKKKTIWAATAGTVVFVVVPAVTVWIIAVIAVREAWPSSTCMTLAEQADVVVIGTVKAIEPRILPEYGRIFSFITLEVEKNFKGSPSNVLTIREFGGRIGNRIDAILYAPIWTEGEHVLLFLDTIPGTSLFTLSLMESKLRIVEKNGTQWVIEVISSPGGAYEVPLSECITQVR